MTIEEFTEALKKEIQGIAGKNSRVKINYVQKNNIGQVPSLNILEKGVSVLPNFYLKDLYEAFQGTGIGIAELAKKLVRIHYENIAYPGQEIAAQFQKVVDFRSRLFFRLIHYERNRELLERIPHIKVLDMALVYYMLVYDDHERVGSIRMDDTVFQYFGWDVEELYQEVIANTERLFPERDTTFSKLVEEMADAAIREAGISEKDLPDFFWKEKYPIVITNTGGINGAAVIVYPGLLQKIAKQVGYNLFILPSSIHECLALPDNGEFFLENLEEMVAAVNQESVSPEEFLSDHVYYYNADSDRLLIAGADALPEKGEEENHV